MPPEPIDPALNIFAFGTMLLSIVACINVIHMRRKGPVLPYEPRRWVPWGPVGGVLAITYLLFTAVGAIGGSDGGRALQSLAPWALIGAMIQQLFIVGAFLVVIAVFTKATSRDVGLPANVVQCARDACVGAAACLAALAPVHMTQVTLMSMLSSEEMKSGHPLVKMVMDAPPNPWILVLAGVAAVVVAPICEEITFRLLLQGWLERWEDERLGWRTLAIESPLTNDDSQIQSETLPADATVALPDPDPPRQGIAGLPYGWFPILISAAAFGLAHFGYGPEPVPIFLLGLVLGYIYQRTHRILPSIVAHALFNLFTMILLWRMICHHG
jgi:membrane protease YdiL (CAAX protease family)